MVSSAALTGIKQVFSERAALVSNRESEEKGDLRLAGSPEGLAMRTADAQAARSAGVSDVKAAQDTNPNKHNGSAGGDQLESIQIIALDDGGKQKVLAERPKEAKPQPEITPEYLRERAKQPDIWAKKFVEDMDKAEKLPAPYKDAQIAKVLKDAEAVYRPRGQAEKPQAPLDQMDTGTLLAHEVKRNPAAEPVQNLHTWAKQLPEGPEKDRYSQLVREQMAELSPEAKARAERLAQVSEKIKAAGLDEGGLHQAVKPDQLVLRGKAQHQENEWEAFTKLDPKQQRDIIKAFEKAGEVGKEAHENQIQAVAESIPKGFYNVGKGLYDNGIAAGTFMIEAADRPEKLPEAAQKLAENISTALMSGLKISEVLAGYSQEVAKSGDYSRPLTDLQTVTTLANERWEAMPLEKRTEKGSELIAEMGVGSVIGAADKLAKSGKLIDALEELAKYAGELTAPGREKARRALGAFLDDVFQPKGLTTNGFEMPIPKKGENWFAMSSEGEGNVFRGDHDLRSRFNTKGQRKSFINESGDLEPADCSGLYNGRPVEIFEHVLGNKHSKVKQFSPYTSFGTVDGVVTKYGNQKLELDLPRLREAIQSGELRGVAIVEHEQVVQAIQNSNLKPFPKKLALLFVRADKEILVKGTIPGRFLKYEQ